MELIQWENQRVIFRVSILNDAIDCNREPERSGLGIAQTKNEEGQEGRKRLKGMWNLFINTQGALTMHQALLQVLNTY